MRSAKREDLFPAWGVEAALSRLRGRQKKFAASPMERKHVARDKRSWSYACVSAVNKMRYRHRAVFQESREPDAWSWVIAVQKKKLVRKVDPVAAWRDAEYRILERYYGRLREPQSKQDRDRWRYVIIRQRSYLRRLQGRAKSGPPSNDWARVLKKMARISATPSEHSSGRGSWNWRTTVAAQREKLRNARRQTGWMKLESRLQFNPAARPYHISEPVH